MDATASFRKRGYIIAPRGKLVVDGFRQSAEAVAAFQFGPGAGIVLRRKNITTRAMSA